MISFKMNSGCAALPIQALRVGNINKLLLLSLIQYNILSTPKLHLAPSCKWKGKVTHFLSLEVDNEENGSLVNHSKCCGLGR
jgi:hypothetical protein